MHFSLTRFLQWGGIAVVLLAVVGLNYDFKSEARVQMNTSVEDSLSQGMRGYWKLDDGSGTNATDSSGNANTLAMTGSPGWVTGNIGPYALDFSGSGQYLSVADPASGVLDFADGADFSLTGWFNRDTFTADHTIVAKKTNQTTNAGYVVWIDASTDTVNFEISDGTDTYEADSTTAFTATGWHHFAAVWDDSRGASVYI
ncbi:MAG: LamG-like jellyroll fold domain-containing protein, partial [Candidatus Moraniibacteriota bacterium]